MKDILAAGQRPDAQRLEKLPRQRIREGARELEYRESRLRVGAVLK